MLNFKIEKEIKSFYTYVYFYTKYLFKPFQIIAKHVNKCVGKLWRLCGFALGDLQLGDDVHGFFGNGFYRMAMPLCGLRTHKVWVYPYCFEYRYMNIDKRLECLILIEYNIIIKLIFGNYIQSPKRMRL